MRYNISQNEPVSTLAPIKSEAGAMDMRDVIRLLRFRPGMTDQQKEMEDPFFNMLLA